MNRRHPSQPGEPPDWIRAEACPRLERYLLGPELGRGGMGRVLEAWDPVLRRVVAIKLLHGSDPDQLLRFLREAQHQARLEHPNICRILDLGQAGDRPYIAMQRIQGRDLSELRPKLAVDDIARILADVAGAVHAAHRAGLIHRDLKPSNILVERLEDGFYPYVVDFGLARDFRGSELTLSWAVMGTPAFMCPEQARCQPLTPAADVYSLGATLYALLSGHPPFESATLAGLLTLQGRGDATLLRRQVPGLPRDLETITLKCLEVEPERRYPSAFALEEDLRRYLAREPILARPVGPVGRAWRWARRRPAFSITLAASLLSLTLLGGWNFRIQRQGRLREQVAQRFALEIRDAEYLLRIEQMMPRHDIRPAEGRLRARMAAIRTEMAGLGGQAQGPGHYALGRGLMSLRDFEGAQREFHTAWAAGFRAPEVAHGLSLTLLKAYEDLWQSMNTTAWRQGEGARRYQELVVPALGWMARARGAKVDQPAYVEALAAWGSQDYDGADRLFAKALEAAPWLVEAQVARARCRAMRPPAAGREAYPDPEAWLHNAEAPLLLAEQLAPSDPLPLLTHAGLHLSKAIIASSRKDRSEAPVLRANELLDAALAIHPGQPALLSLAGGTTLQLGFLFLSSGRDPGRLVRDKARAIEAMHQAPAWEGEAERLASVGNLHNLWWVALDADLRFGRDPTEALAQTGRWRRAMPANVHHAFPLLLEARWRRCRGQDPAPLYREAYTVAQAILDPQPNEANAFVHTVLGECLLEQAEWERDQGGDGVACAARAIEHLQGAIGADPGLAFTYYFLPRAFALQARGRCQAGRDPDAPLQAALDAAGKGLAINPRNALLQFGAADAFLAAAQVGANSALPWLAKARRALDLGEAINPNLWQAKRLRAEVELEAARRAREAGLPWENLLALALAACRQGRRLNGLEPSLGLLLERIEAFPGPGAGPTQT